jgi:hypothetical protein
VQFVGRSYVPFRVKGDVEDSPGGGCDGLDA